MPSEQQQLEAAIAALEAQRTLLGGGVVEAALGPMRDRLSALTGRTAPEPAQTLKQVTILFLDVVGSTALSQRLDPEETHAMMDGALARGTAVVQEHHGKVLQYAGDNLLAAFGAYETREDDAERAVRCGLALLELGRALGIEVQVAHGHAGFDVRVGIHSGGVVLGGGVDAEGTIRGIAVNIAARMEQTAPAGRLRISHDTYTQVRGLFEVDVQPPLQVKGVDEPVQSYLVQRAKPRSFRIATRGIEGVATRMVGRDAELEALQDAFRCLFAEPAAERRLAAVTVVAEAGVGKSRLLYEFEAWSEALPERFYLFRGRATPQTQGQPYGLLRDVLAWRFQIADDDTIPAARAKIERGMMPLFQHDEGADDAEGHAHLLGHLVGIDFSDSRHIRGIVDDPKQIRNRAFHAAAQMFRRISARDGNPIVLELEDLHWADNESLDFLNYLAEVSRDVPMLVLGFARPTLFERRTDWKSTEGIHVRIDMAPLDKTGSRMLANELLKKLPEIPAALRELVTGGAEGNPFYMEELVKMLIDQGAITTDAEPWELHADRLLATQVPSTLTGVLQARLDSLPASEKVTLQEASVIGYIFWDRALIALDAQARDTLPRLVDRDLALPRADAAQAKQDDLREYAFKHHILHQVTYATVLKRIKRELHGKLAQWLAGQTGLRANDFLGAAAEHYEKAGDAANAAEYCARAAEHARDRYAHDAALDHVQRGLAQVEDIAPDKETGCDRAALQLRWRLLEVREERHKMQGSRDEQRADLEALERIAEVLDDDGRRAQVAWKRCTLALGMADWLAVERSARQAIVLAERVGNNGLRLRANFGLAWSLAQRGDIELGKAIVEEGLAETREHGLRRIEGEYLHIMAGIVAMQEDLMSSIELERQAVHIHREVGNRGIEAYSLKDLGTGWLELGDLSQAQRELDEALRMARTMGSRDIECGVLCSLSLLARWKGDDVMALTLARSSSDIAAAVGSRDIEACALFLLGEAELALGRHAGAARAFEQAQARSSEMNSPYQRDATAGLARLALVLGQSGAAMHHVERLLADAAQGGTLVGTGLPRYIELTCHQVLACAGDPRANEWLERAHANLQIMAAAIPDEALRKGFLANIPHHREIVATWQQAHRQGGGGSSGIR